MKRIRNALNFLSITGKFKTNKVHNLGCITERESTSYLVANEEKSLEAALETYRIIGTVPKSKVQTVKNKKSNTSGDSDLDENDHLSAGPSKTGTFKDTAYANPVEITSSPSLDSSSDSTRRGTLRRKKSAPPRPPQPSSLAKVQKLKAPTPKTCPQNEDVTMQRMVYQDSEASSQPSNAINDHDEGTNLLFDAKNKQTMEENDRAQKTKSKAPQRPKLPKIINENVTKNLEPANARSDEGAGAASMDNSCENGAPSKLYEKDYIPRSTSSGNTYDEDNTNGSNSCAKYDMSSIAIQDEQRRADMPILGSEINESNVLDKKLAQENTDVYSQKRPTSLFAQQISYDCETEFLLVEARAKLENLDDEEKNAYRLSSEFGIIDPPTPFRENQKMMTKSGSATEGVVSKKVGLSKSKAPPRPATPLLKDLDTSILSSPSASKQDKHMNERKPSPLPRSRKPIMEDQKTDNVTLPAKQKVEAWINKTRDTERCEPVEGAEHLSEDLKIKTRLKDTENDDTIVESKVHKMHKRKAPQRPPKPTVDNQQKLAENEKEGSNKNIVSTMSTPKTSHNTLDHQLVERQNEGSMSDATTTETDTVVKGEVRYVSGAVPIPKPRKFIAKSSDSISVQAQYNHLPDARDIRLVLSEDEIASYEVAFEKALEPGSTQSIDVMSSLDHDIIRGDKLKLLGKLYAENGGCDPLQDASDPKSIEFENLLKQK